MADPFGMHQDGPAKAEPIRVLVVDDHAPVRDAVRRLLGRARDILVVGCAGDGRHALELAGELGPDVVVMDLAMPVLDGIEATRALRCGPHQSAVVALTASTSLAARALEEGAAACVFKDSAPGELVRAVRDAARGS